MYCMQPAATGTNETSRKRRRQQKSTPNSTPTQARNKQSTGKLGQAAHDTHTHLHKAPPVLSVTSSRSQNVRTARATTATTTTTTMTKTTKEKHYTTAVPVAHNNPTHAPQMKKKYKTPTQQQ